MKRALLVVGLIFVGIMVSACGGSRAVNNPSAFERSASDAKSDLNKQIVDSAVQAKAFEDEQVYKLGKGDVLELTVFQVDELNTKIRVNGRGNVILPLLGKIQVKDKSLSEVEDIIAQKLSEEYLNDPQVSLYVEEYRSQQVTVMGAVENPNVYSIRQTRSIFEMLSLAGGLTSEASDTIRVKTTQIDPQSQTPVMQDLILSVKALLAGAEAASHLRLAGGDSIMVPEAGVIFVEGAVEKPGSYVMEGETNVLKAVAMAGGVPWAGKEGQIQVIRDIAGEPFAIDVNLKDIREQKGDDVILKDGDIVVVDYSTTKRFLSGFFRTAGQIFGYNLNR